MVSNDNHAPVVVSAETDSKYPSEKLYDFKINGRHANRGAIIHHSRTVKIPPRKSVAGRLPPAAVKNPTPERIVIMALKSQMLGSSDGSESVYKNGTNIPMPRYIIPAPIALMILDRPIFQAFSMSGFKPRYYYG